MKDLYRELGLSRNATNEQLAEALGKNPEWADYASVLLNERKRAVYDRAHAALTAIGALRQRLGLDKEASWFAEKNPDFSPAVRNAPSATTETNRAPAAESSAPSAPAPKAAVQSSSRPKARRVGRGSLIVLVLAAVALAVILYIALS